MATVGVKGLIAHPLYWTTVVLFCCILRCLLYLVVFSLRRPTIFLYCFVCQYRSSDWLWRPPPKWPIDCVWWGVQLYSSWTLYCVTVSITCGIKMLAKLSTLLYWIKVKWHSLWVPVFAANLWKSSCEPYLSTVAHDFPAASQDSPLSAFLPWLNYLTFGLKSGPSSNCVA